MPQGAHDANFGARLRHAREERGVSLRTIAHATKISMLALEALERDDISHLPGGLFTRAFVRGYAREVGLDPEETVRQFVESFPEEHPSAADAQQRSAPRREVRIELGPGAAPIVGRVFTVVAAVALLVAYLAWSGRFASWQRGRTVAPQPLIPVTAMEETVTVPSADASGAMLLTDRPVTPGTEPVETPTDPVAAADRAPLPDGVLRLSMSTSGHCWVSVRSNGVHSFAGTMEAGDQHEVDVHGRVSLTVGDAGVFSYAINGLPARPMGGAGEVTTVVFSAQTYKSFLQTP
jgi:cytoskeleton protein RodZ